MVELLVNELYDQLTWQGEGQSLGRLCSFIRLYGCPLFCRYCDSAFTWRTSEKHPHNFAGVYDPKQESKRMTIAEITEHFRPLDPPMIVITGGEPLLQTSKLPPLIDNLMNQISTLTRIEIETAGTLSAKDLLNYDFVHFNISPKLENSGNPKELRFKPDILHEFNHTHRAVFKFVACQPSDLDEIQEIVEEVEIPGNRIWVMPEGIDGSIINERTQLLAEEVLKRRWNLTTRLHVLIWGNRRGV